MRPGNPNHLWWVIAGFVAAFALLAAYANSSDNIQMLVVCYAAFGLSILGSWVVLHSGVLYLRGVPIYRANQPFQFWVALARIFLPLSLVSGFFIAMHLRSLFAA